MLTIQTATYVSLFQFFCEEASAFMKVGLDYLDRERQ